MRKLAHLLSLFVLATTYSCSKSDSGGSGGTTYQPMTAGSNWTYVDSNYTTTATNTYTLTVSNTDTTINARVYRIFNSTNGIKQYFNISGSDYYQYRGLGVGNANLEFLYLKDNYSVGQTWSTNSTVSIDVTGIGTVPVNVSILYKIEEKLASYAVSGVTYNDVIRVSSVPTFTVTGLPLTINTSSNINYYYAKGVGMVYNRFQLDVSTTGFSQSVNTMSRLKTYTIQ